MGSWCLQSPCALFVHPCQMLDLIVLVSLIFHFFLDVTANIKTLSVKICQKQLNQFSYKISQKKAPQRMYQELTIDNFLLYTHLSLQSSVTIEI